MRTAMIMKVSAVALAFAANAAFGGEPGYVCVSTGTPTVIKGTKTVTAPEGLDISAESLKDVSSKVVVTLDGTALPVEIGDIALKPDDIKVFINGKEIGNLGGKGGTDDSGVCVKSVVKKVFVNGKEIDADGVAKFDESVRKAIKEAEESSAAAAEECKGSCRCNVTIKKSFDGKGPEFGKDRRGRGDRPGAKRRDGRRPQGPEAGKPAPDHDARKAAKRLNEKIDALQKQIDELKALLEEKN